MTFYHNLTLSGGRDLLQDQHQLHRPSRPNGSADRHREREPGDHRALAELQRVRRRCPAARNPEGSGGSRWAAAQPQEAQWWHAGMEGVEGGYRGWQVIFRSLLYLYFFCYYGTFSSYPHYPPCWLLNCLFCGNSRLHHLSCYIGTLGFEEMCLINKIHYYYECKSYFIHEAGGCQCTPRQVHTLAPAGCCL